MAVAGEADRAVAVQVLHARLEVNAQVAPFVVVVHRVFHVHIHAAQGIHHFLGRVNVEDHIMGDVCS